jgi:hypothetical protein
MTQVSVMANTVLLSEAIPNDLTIPETPKVPLLAQAISGVQSQRFERVMVTSLNLSGESAPSAEAVLQVSANNVLVVSQFETKFTGDYPGKPYAFNVYATTGATGTETKQNTVPIPTGQSWQEPATGLVVGSALPTAAAPNPSDTANTNVVNAAPPTGNLISPQAPSGTSVTNTGRSNQSTETYMANSLNALNVGTTPPPTGNLRH